MMSEIMSQVQEIGRVLSGRHLMKEWDEKLDLM